LAGEIDFVRPVCASGKYGGVKMVIYGRPADEAWDATEEPEAAIPIDGDSMSAELTRLCAQARLRDHQFLAHLIGMAAMEAERLEEEEAPRKETPSAP
jgi:hypothetical protein